MYTDAFERKLGPVYGAIESQNYKASTARLRPVSWFETD
jgi:hypothetical protein